MDKFSFEGRTKCGMLIPDERVEQTIKAFIKS